MSIISGVCTWRDSNKCLFYESYSYTCASSFAKLCSISQVCLYLLSTFVTACLTSIWKWKKYAVYPTIGLSYLPYPFVRPIQFASCVSEKLLTSRHKKVWNQYLSVCQVVDPVLCLGFQLKTTEWYPFHLVINRNYGTKKFVMCIYTLKGLKTELDVNTKQKIYSFILGVYRFYMWYKSDHNKITLPL